MNHQNRKKISHFNIFFILFFLSRFLYSQDRPSIQIVYTDTPPKIDGKVDEAVWEKAAKISQLYQRLPNTGSPVSKNTVFYFLYDENYLYIGAKCADDPKKITAKELARDANLAQDDRIQLIIDTFHDRRNAYWFQIGPRGSIGDALVSENGAGFNKQWDGLWEGKSKIHDKGWDTELALPFKTLNFRPGDTTWGLKLIRHIKRKMESAYWPQANLDAYGFQVSDAGDLTGLKNITKGVGLDIRPYALAGIDYNRSENNKYIFDFGGEVFYNVTPGLKAALTVNTDFAQTEADSRQINLTRFSLHFPEKRDFFLDGSNYFNFGLSGERRSLSGKRNITFFSRRIGLDEEGNPIPIIYGVKMTGQAGSWNLGLQNIMDHPDDKFRNFIVARVSRNIGKQSYIGFIGTQGNASGPEGNYLTGLDLRLATSTFKGNKNVAFTGFGLKSWTDGLSGRDVSFGVDLNYPNDFFFFRLGHQQIGENYRAGIGFVPRVGIRESYANAGIGPRPNKWGVQQIKLSIGIDYITDMQNKLLSRIIQINVPEIEFQSGDRILFGSNMRHEFLEEDFNIFPDDSIVIHAGEYDFWRNAISLKSAQRRNLFAAFEYVWGDFYDGNRSDVNVKMGYKIFVPLFIGIEFEQNDVFLNSGDFQTRIYRANVNVFFSPDITLTNFIQYDNISRSVGMQSRFRWIFKPGNEILFVWNSAMNESPENDRFKVYESSTRLKLNYNLRF